MTTWKENRISYETRLQKASKSITTTDLTLGATSQSIDFDAALPAGAIICAEWVNVTEGFASTGVATKATKTTGNTETFSMTDGMTVLLNVDAAGEDTATFNFAAGTIEDTTYYPVADQDGNTLNVNTDGAGDELVTLGTPCTTAAHVRAFIAAQTTGNTVSQGTTAQAAFIPTNTVDATFELIVDGDTAVIDVDDAGADTATWNIARASSTGAAATYNLLNGKTLIVTIDSGTSQTITFTAAAVDAATTNEEINAQLIGGSSVVNGTETDIFSDQYGTGSHVNITGGTGLAEIGHGIADNVGTGDAVDGHAVTIAEVKTFLEGDITGSSGIVVADIGSNRFSITSGTTGVDSELDVQSGTLLAKLGITAEIVIGTADQVLITSDTLGTGSTIVVTNVDSDLTWAAASDGTGDAVNSAAVTAAEVVAVFDADFTTASPPAVNAVNAGAVSTTSDTSGTSSTLNYGAGTANAVLGLTDETITGVDAVDGTATIDLGVKSGDTDALLDGANVTSAVAEINAPKGAAPNGHYGGDTLAVKVDSNVNVNLLTAGAMEVFVLYSDQTGKL
jgi:hypothetical protein